MTTQYAILKGLPAGLTFTSAKLFTLAAPDTEVTGNTFGFVNRTNATSQYVVSIDRATALPAGGYTLIAYLATGPRAELQCTFAGTDGETATETPEVAVLDTSTQTLIQNIHNDVEELTAKIYVLGTSESGSSTTVIFDLVSGYTDGMLVGWVMRLMTGCTHRITATTMESIVFGTISRVTATLATPLLDTLDSGEEITLYPDVAVDLSGVASQTSVNDLPTNAELATALASADDAVLAAISALNNLSAAQVNSELLDVLNVDTFAELSAPPAASSTLSAKLTWLFMWARNKATQSTTERKLYADDGTTVISTEAVGDSSGTFTKGEAS